MTNSVCCTGKVLSHTVRAFTLVCAFAVFNGCRTANVAGPKDSGTTFARDALAPYVERGELPGAVCVFYNNGVQETACVGYADAGSDARRTITINDHYMQCSQTKGFCGVTIAKLVEEGKISLDDPVSKYLPEFKNLYVKGKADANGSYQVAKAKNTLTVRMVMNHTGGFEFELPNFQSMGGWARRMPLRSVAATAAGIPLKFEPGTKVQYSNVGIDIGAAIVEVVSGQRWEDYLKENVLLPLGMTASGFWPSDKDLDTKIEMYDVKGGRPAKWMKQNASQQQPYGDDRVFASAGAGLWTTAADQLKFYKMLMNLGIGENGVRILKEETVKELLAKSSRPKGMGGYSLGLTAPEEDNDDAWFGHGGAWGTNCSVNWHKKQLKLWAVQNCGGPRPWEGAKDKAAEKFFKTTIDNSGIDAYTGRVK
ncbi:MAG: beta-lactamase family protein [Kiritimatiellae bacterium]|nr:beta-lactamase family protein [Kiritimatiellia bacterium]